MFLENAMTTNMHIHMQCQNQNATIRSRGANTLQLHWEYC
jgi:hypothetical protein